MKKVLLLLITSFVVLSCSKKSDIKADTCYECSLIKEIKDTKTGVLYSSETGTSTRCKIDQNTIDQETKDKNYVEVKGSSTTTSTYSCKIKSK